MEHSLYDVDKEARFQKVYDAYMQAVYRLCFSYMKNKMDTEDAVQETEMLQLVLNLPVKYKTVVYLYYYEGYNSVQIAKLLKKPESTIRTYLQKAKKLLKQELNEGNAVGVNQGSVYQTREE